MGFGEEGHGPRLPPPPPGPADTVVVTQEQFEAEVRAVMEEYEIDGIEEAVEETATQFRERSARADQPTFDLGLVRLWKARLMPPSPPSHAGPQTSGSPVPLATQQPAPVPGATKAEPARQNTQSAGPVVDSTGTSSEDENLSSTSSEDEEPLPPFLPLPPSLLLPDPLPAAAAAPPTRAAAASTPLAPRPVVLFLGGSFSPVHPQHLRCFDVARAALEAKGCAVVGGFLVCSSDEYVRSKLGKRAIDLEERVALCRCALANTPSLAQWVEVYPEGIVAPGIAAHNIRRLIGRRLEVEVQTMQIVGADLALGGWIAPEMVCVMRPPFDAAFRRMVAQDGIALPRSFVLASDTDASPETRGLSSTQVRALMEEGGWDQLRLAYGSLLAPVVDGLKWLRDKAQPAGAAEGAVQSRTSAHNRVEDNTPIPELTTTVPHILDRFRKVVQQAMGFTKPKS